jgi:hypothetical protein
MLQDNILRGSEISCMDFDFDKCFERYSCTISDFGISCFTSNNIVPPKAHVFASALFSKCVHDMKVKFNMTTIQKLVFGCLQTTYANEFSFNYLY